MRVTMQCAEHTLRFGVNDAYETSCAMVTYLGGNTATIAMPGVPPGWISELAISYTEGSSISLVIDGYTVLKTAAPESVSAMDYFAAFSQKLAVDGDPMAALIAATLGPRATGSDGMPISEEDARALKPFPQHTTPIQTSTFSQIEATGLFVFHDGRMLVGEKEDARALVPGQLYVPGGKVEVGETVTACALRELKEETGIEQATAECIGVFHHVDELRQRVYTFYQIFFASASNHLNRSDDLHNMLWLDLSTLSRANLFYLTRCQLLLFMMTSRWRRRLGVGAISH